MLPEASGDLAQTTVSPAGKGLGECRAPSCLFFSGCSIHPGRLASVRRLGWALYPGQGLDVRLLGEAPGAAAGGAGGGFANPRHEEPQCVGGLVQLGSLREASWRRGHDGS